MSVYETIFKRRSIRRFKNKKIPNQILEKCVNAAHLAPSASNLQPWEFIIVDREDLLYKVFDALAWGGYTKTEEILSANEEAKAYIVILINENIGSKRSEYDVGIAAGYITLVALEHGIGSCCFATINHRELRQILNIPDTHKIAMVVALGYPNESPVAEEFTGTTDYRRDGQGTLHVPKRKLADILHKNGYGQ